MAAALEGASCAWLPASEDGQNASKSRRRHCLLTRAPCALEPTVGGSQAHPVHLMQNVDEVYPRGLPVEFVLQGTPPHSLRLVLPGQASHVLHPFQSKSSPAMVHQQGCVSANKHKQLHSLGTPGLLCSAATCLVQESKQEPCRVQVCNAGADQTVLPHTSQQVAFLQPGAHQRKPALLRSFKWG